jgi:hypothetical protein
MDHFISLPTAIGMTTRYREMRTRILQPGYQERDLLPFSETFDRKAFDKLLSQPGCTEIRVYYGMDREKKVHAILVGVDEQNRDMLPSSTEAVTPEEEENSIVEVGQRCPPECPPIPDCLFCL